jgi:hypothetical protein
MEQLDQLVSDFAEAVVKQSEAVSRCDAEAGNEFAMRYVADFEKLRGARLGSLSVTNTSTHQSLYSGSYGYNELDQRISDTISRVNVANNGTTSTESAGYTYVYDLTHADALTTVKDASNNVLYSYTPDGVGNLTGTALGSVNLLNQYSADLYNSRGDVTDNGTYTLQWDASDRPVVITPKSVVTGSLQLKLGYDSSDRWLWKDVYSWNGSAWVYDYSRHEVWDGSNLVVAGDHAPAQRVGQHHDVPARVGDMQASIEGTGRQSAISNQQSAISILFEPEPQRPKAAIPSLPTGFCSRPIFSISTTTVSPSFIQTGGLRAMPTP